MSYRNLLDGDCGRPSSLINFVSHQVTDHGFKDEGIHLPYSQPTDAIQIPHTDQLVQEFLEESACPQTFRMDNLLQEMTKIDENLHTPLTTPRTADELTYNLHTNWTKDYFESGKHFEKYDMDNIHDASSNQPAQEESIRLSETDEISLHPKWAEDYIEQTIQNYLSTNNNAKFMEFAEQEVNIPGNSVIPTFGLEDTAEESVEKYHINQQNTDNETIDSTVENEVFSKLEEELQAAGTGWIDEFLEDTMFKGENSHNSSYFNELQKEHLNIMNSEHPWISEFNLSSDAQKNYKFHEENPMKNLPNALEEGKKRLEEGDLPGAVLCFEAAVQQDENNIEAWLLLGKTQAENEQDCFAIPALNRCLQLDPSNTVALMALAVCYANESHMRSACLILKEWLLKNEKYKHLFLNTDINQNQPVNFSTNDFFTYDNVHAEVMEFYLQAARMNPNEVDPDVQCGLGVLLNLSHEYEKASDCFRIAVQSRPNDSRLWNRWGATLANGYRSEEAIAAYRRALELSPGFIRARYNLGISCINLKAYQEAGEHLLVALNQQAAGRRTFAASTTSDSIMSASIWSTLKLVLSLMHKYDEKLMEAVEKRDLTILNKEFKLTPDMLDSI